MNLEKLYQETGGDMAGAVRRLGSASAVERFLRMFAGDDTFAMLEAAMSAGDDQRAFRAAHTLKALQVPHQPHYLLFHIQDDVILFQMYCLYTYPVSF